MVRYPLAVASCAAAFVVRFLLDPLLRDRSPLILFEAAVAISAIVGGSGPGILATLLGAFGALYFFPPMGTFIWIAEEYRPTAILQLLVFFLVGFILTWLSHQLRRLRWQALELAKQRNEILESISDGFEALDRNWRFVYLNKVAAQLAKIPRDDLVGKNIWEMIPGLRGTLVENKLRESMDQQTAVHFEYLSKSSNRWLEFHAYPAGNGGLTIYFSDISDRKLTELRLRETLAERDAALENVRVLSGLLPICAGCKKIRDEQGNWNQIESYIATHSQAKFTHGMCPDCARRYFGDLAGRTG